MRGGAVSDGRESLDEVKGIWEQNELQLHEETDKDR